MSLNGTFFKEKVWPIFAQHGVVGVLLLLFLASHFGYIQSEGTKTLEAAEAIKARLDKHEESSKDTQRKLERVIKILNRQAELQAITARQTCLQNAKTEAARNRCAEIQ